MASKNIKGITIEIGGNTTKLQDALKDVDKQVYSLNSDLKTLNQALKLDPKNTELLAQKQDVLARNISATKERVDTLKEALRQMGDYNKLTDEQKASYNQLSLEITKSEKALKDMNKELKATSSVDLSKLKDGLQKVGDIALDVSKKMLQVSAAIGTALAGVVAAGVKSYASLEQNLGGIETLFGESADKVVENAKNAYKTAGVSANEYMEGVTSFSASLLQGLGGDTAKAADIADMAFKDMADNANKFGTSMDSVTAAYQGFSKQQYQLLDNLKLGYGGTKTEMERLLSDAEKFSGVHYDINNLSDVYSAIHVIQEELGVTGTTAEEAATTISGSAASMKAALDNFLNGSGSPEALADAFSTMLENIVGAVEKLAPSLISGIQKLITTLVPKIAQLLVKTVPQLFKAVGDVIKNVLDMVKQNTSSIEQTITDLLNSVIEFITENLTLILDLGIQILLALVNGIVGAIPTLAEALPELITTIINVLVENIPAILDAAIKLLMALVEAIPVIIKELVDNLPTIIDTIITTLLDNGPMLWDAAIELFFALVKAVPEICIQLVKIVPTIVKSIVTTLWDNRDKVLESGKKILHNIRDGIVNNLTDLWEKVKEIPEKVKGWITDGLSALWDVGQDMVKGIWNGISDGYEWICNKIKGWVGNVTDFFKKVLGISSPSKVMANSVGKYMAEGIGMGFENEIDSVEKDMVKSMSIDDLVSDVNSALVGLNAGIQASVNPNINPKITYETNYNMMAQAVKEALEDMTIELDDREVGRFVISTVSEEVF